MASSLTELDLYDNAIGHINGLDALTKLHSLDLSFNNIKHIKRLDNLTELRNLYFVQNRIAKIEGLDSFAKLRNLELGANRVREIEGIAHLTALEELWLGKNKITELKVPPLPLFPIDGPTGGPRTTALIGVRAWTRSPTYASYRFSPTGSRPSPAWRAWPPLRSCTSHTTP